MTDTTPSLREQLVRRIESHIRFIYPDMSRVKVEALLTDIMVAMRFNDYIARPQIHHNPWTQQDAIVITYGDSIFSEGKLPLRTLREFMRAELVGYVSGVHVLPFFPWSSDDGFAVTDYLSVDEELGTWDDITAIAGDFILMSDLVINHCSSAHQWFQNFKKRVHPGLDYFIEGDPHALPHEVVRPRVSPLLRATETEDGTRHVWCTFSHDQVDVDFRNTQVLLEFIHIVRFYLDRGVRIFRLDAVAFLWKEVNTRCINLPQTHEIVRLFRTLIEHCDPEAIIITETNIPNRENLSYFGNVNEAHCIYNFSLPPLLLYSLASGNCQQLRTWLMSMPPARNGTAYLNFIASHDGIGLRPAEGLLEDAEIDRLVVLMQEFGGRISWRSVGEELRRPYEINIALYDAFRGTLNRRKGEAAGNVNPGCSGQMARFICAHTIMLALEGIPAIYIHSFFGTLNDERRVELSGQNRAINRHQWRLEDLQEALADPDRHHGQLFDHMRHLLDVRHRQPAFHPNAMQLTLQLGDHVLGFWRQSINHEQNIFCLHNISDEPQTLPLAAVDLVEPEARYDLLGEVMLDFDGGLQLEPYQCLWLTDTVAGRQSQSRL